MHTGIVLADQEKKRAYGDRIFAQERLPPAILLAGPRASGKASLAFEFAQRHLCQAPDKGARPCGVCIACRETARLAYPDCIVFSARDIMPACRALQAIASRARIQTLAYEIDFLARRAVQRIRSGFFKLKDITNKETEALEERIALLLKRTAGALQEAAQEAVADETLLRAGFADSLDEIAELDALVQHGVLPIAGIQEIIRILSLRPVMGQRRVVFIEGIETFRPEGANAFLKTLEEPPADTLILMTASDLKGVLATIRSRSAILPLARMTGDEIRRIAGEYYGLEAGSLPPEEDGGRDACGLPPLEHRSAAGAYSRDIYAYLEAQGEGQRLLHKDIVRFLELIRGADHEPSFFDFAKDIEKRKAALDFCGLLSDLLAENVVTKETRLGSERVFANVFAHYESVFLRRMLRELHTLTEGIRRNNFSASQGISAVMLAFWNEEQA
jgi:DNA polymerase III delta prime subunit